jgi:predicted metal-dependent phosphoesterase TrpH
MELASAYPDILIIPGVEITTPKGDMLVLGTEQLPPKPWDPENVADYAKSIGGVSIIAHPFRLYGMGEFARNVKVDAIEVYNGGSSTSANTQAKALAKSMGLPGTAGSDAHQLSELFSVNCRIDSDLNVDEVLNSIRKGSISAQISTGTIRF